MIIVFVAFKADGQTITTTTSVTDGRTPSALQPGSPAGSYPLSGFDNINLYNGNLNFRLPLLQIGGRGSAQMKMMLALNLKGWHIRHTNKLMPDENEYHSYVPTQLGWTPYSDYGAGRLSGRNYGLHTSSNFSCRWYSKTLSRLTFSASDGTEYEVRDQLTNGQPLDSTCTQGAFRGTVFVTADGTAATFVSDTAIYDNPAVNVFGPHGFSVSGYLMLRDGTRYRIDSGNVTWIRDRNGNKMSFTYTSTSMMITDSLNRTVTVNYDVSDVAPYGLCDQIIYKGFGGSQRILRVSKTNLGNALRPNSGYTIKTLGGANGLFPEADGSSSTYHDPTVKSAVWLPDGRSYRFYYNSYGELARVELPTGGAFEYDMTPGSGVICLNSCWPDDSREIYRRLVERRVYSNGGSGSSFERRDVYTNSEAVGSSTSSVTVEQLAPSGTVLARSRHSFATSALNSLFGGDIVYAYGAWYEGNETQTDALSTTGDIGTATVLRRSVTNRAQRAPVSWWPAHASTYGLDPTKEPPNDPRITENIATIEPATANLVSKQTFGYDDSVPFNNQNNVKEYGFGNGSPGGLVRETRTTFLTTSVYTDTSVHIRNLPVQVSVYDAGGTERARSTTEYDNYGFDSFHAGLISRTNISGFDPAFSTGFTTRGNATNSTNYLLVNGSVTGSISTYAQYDIVGNIVRAIDARSTPSNIIATTVEYDDRYGSPDSEARSNTIPTELTGLSSFAFPTKLINPLGHTTYTQFEYYLGQPVNGEDVNGIVSAGYFNDVLDRPTQIRRAIGTSLENQTTFAYDAINRVITTSNDLNANNDNVLLSKVLYDPMGRTTEKRQYEGGSNYIVTQMQYDALGRPFKTSNPFRPWQSETAVWTTQLFDALGRSISVTTPDSAVVSTSYSGNTTTVTDQAGKTRKSVTDALGRLTDVYEDPFGVNYQTTYTYDVLDNLIRVAQGSQQRFFIYDSLKRLIRTRNPEQGTYAALNLSDPLTGNSAWSIGYEYDSGGNLTQKTDARGVVSSYQYDALNRNTTIDYSDTSAVNPDVKRFYDGATNGKGRFWYFYTGGDFSTGSNVDHTAIDSYDELGRPLIQRQLFKLNGVWSATYQTSRAYNLAVGVTSQTYPSGHTVAYLYDSAGRTNSFTGNLGDGVNRNYSTEIVYSAFGGMTKEKFGTDTPLYNKSFYNSRGQLSEIRVGTTYSGPSDTGWERGAIINHYSAQCWGMCSGSAMTDNNGNLKQQDHFIPDSSGGVQAVFTQAYTYDNLNRLQRVQEGSWQQEFVYDRWGNRTIHQTNTWGIGINKKDFSVDPNNNRLGGPAGQSAVMTYDAAGNLTNDSYTGAGAREYDAENRMTKAWGGNNQWQEYTYNADGKRVRRKVDGVETRQVYGMDGELLAEYVASGAVGAPQKEYGYRKGQLLIVAEAAGGGGTSQNVTWTNAVGVSVAANNLTKTVGDDWLNARASSTQAINSGNGYVEFTASETTTHRMLGLGEFGSGYYTYTNIRYAIYLAGSVLYTEEYGSLTNVGSYSTGDQLRVAVENGAVKYYKNGSLLRTSSLAPTYPLYVNVAMYTNGSTLTGAVISDGSSSPGSIYCLVADHLGTPRMIIDQTGSLANVKRHDYLPFGEELFAGTGGRTVAHGYTGDGVRQRFTDKERDIETEMDFFEVRYFSSKQGRFTGLDPYNPMLDSEDEEHFMKYLSQPQQWNRYAYVTNNPLRYIDPTGARLELKGDIAAAFARIKALVGKAAALLYTYTEKGRTFVEYKGSHSNEGQNINALMKADPGGINVYIEKIISSTDKIIEFQVTESFDTKFRSGVRTGEYCGGGCTVGAEESLTGNTQIFVNKNSSGFAETAFNDLTHGIKFVGPPGRIWAEDDIVDAHEFGHAFANAFEGKRVNNSAETYRRAIDFENHQRATYPDRRPVRRIKE